MTQTLKLLKISSLVFMIAGCSLYDCGNDIYQRLDSRDRSYKILKYSRDCGATTGVSTQISLLPFKKELSNEESGNVFVCDAYISDSMVKVQWVDDSSVLIIYNKGLEVFKKNSTINGITIKYKFK